MVEFHLSPASEDDFPAIRLMIRQANINPMDLDWRRFIVARNDQGQIIGCGQVKPHRGGIEELASIAVEPDWRGKGVARAIIENLLSIHPGELYLTCRSALGDFYRKFGFYELDAAEMPAYYRRIVRIVSGMRKVHLIHDRLLVMRRDPVNDPGETTF